ncbi:hypothetical protein ACHAW6_003307, partial [Cyclotella cf. meneghiniana]
PTTSSLFASLQIPSNHTAVGLSNLLSSNSQIKSLSLHKRLPDAGWSDVQIQRLLLELSVLDTNCDETVQCQFGGVDATSSSSGFAHRWTGAGERERRIYSNLVSQRHFGLGHGIGRSGDVMESQPKAVGSSDLLRLTLRLALDAFRRGAGINGNVGKGDASNGPAAFGTLLPVCTGMSVSLVLDTGKNNQTGHERNHIVVENRSKELLQGNLIRWVKMHCPAHKKNPDTDEVSTDLDALQDALDIHGNSVLAVLTTTSCFCPRVPDEVDNVAKLIRKWNEGKPGAGVSHVINHAYGLQCQRTNELLNRACTIGRVDAIICSTDKSVLVPVGGALILSTHSNVIDSISKNYPGRASASPMMDLFMTLLSMGFNGYKAVLEQRMRLVNFFRESLERVATVFGEIVLNCPRNTISFGITLDNLTKLDNNNVNNDDLISSHVTPSAADDDAKKQHQELNSQITKFGSMLFTRCISGTRVLPCGSTNTISGHLFHGFGSLNDNYPRAYMTAACAVGMGEEEMKEFFVRLEKAWIDYRSKMKKR